MIKMKEKHIYFRLNGGLGNQLSQYAAAKKFERENKIRIKFDDYYLKKSKKTHEKLILNNLFYDVITLDTLNSKISRFVNRLLNKLKFNSYNILGYIFYFDEYPDIVEYNIITVVEGFWQNNYIYKKSVALEIYNKLKEKFYLDFTDVAENLLKKISLNENAIALHIRRGDYLTNRRFFKKQQFVLPDAYYVNAVNRIVNSSQGVLDIYIFSDDNIDKNFLKDLNRVKITIIERSNFSDLQALFLMANFKTIIVANSTYSLWASILSFYINHGKTFGPYLWHKGNDNIDILPKNIEIIKYD